MTPALTFLFALGITIVVSFLVVGYLKPELLRLLTDLCGTEDRARFWAAFSNVTLVLVPLIFAMHHYPEGGPASSAVFEVSEQLEWALIGLVVGVLTLGIIVSRFIPRRGPGLGEQK